jgi:hypothetical protein
MGNYTTSNLILYNANVLTMDAKNPKAEAVGIVGDKISFVGQDDEIRTMQHDPSTQHIDLKGKTVVPGFIDSHVHFMQRGLQSFELDLRDSCSIDDVLSRLNSKVREAEKGKWIIGYGWDESKWRDGRFITRKDIDKASPDNPVVLKRICMHVWVLNSRAVEALNTISTGLFSMTKRSSSSEEINLHTGHLNVSLRGDVKEVLKGCFSPLEDELQNALQHAQAEAVRLGITSIHDMTPYPDFLRKANEEEKLYIRNYACPSFDCVMGNDEREIIPYSETLRIGAVKIFADGSLGTRTAALVEPYADDKRNSGALAWSQHELDGIVTDIHTAGKQIAIHAVGDRAIASVLDALEKAIRANPRPDHRHRIEHCEVVNNKQISRIRDLNIIVSAQPNFIGQWGSMGGLYEKRLGKERWGRMNPLAQFKREGIRIAFGSDGMPFGPMYGIWSCVNHPMTENRLSPEDAIRYYTYGGAYASFDETRKGTIEVGKLADIVALSDDITSIPLSDIKDTRILMTIIGGKVFLDTSDLIKS